MNIHLQHPSVFVSAHLGLHMIDGLQCGAPAPVCIRPPGKHRFIDLLKLKGDGLLYHLIPHGIKRHRPLLFPFMELYQLNRKRMIAMLLKFQMKLLQILLLICLKHIICDPVHSRSRLVFQYFLQTYVQLLQIDDLCVKTHFFPPVCCCTSVFPDQTDTFFL